MLQQLLMLFGFFSLVLALVFWVNKAVSLLDWLMGDGQSVTTFLQLTLLSLPTILVRMLPIAAFVATVNVANRLASESELVVVQAAGYSPYRLARPVLIFGAIVGLMVAVLAHVLVPLSQRELDLRRTEIARDITAQFLKEGTFVHPTAGVTFYVRNITVSGELEDIYLSNSRSAGQRQSFMASRALIAKDDTGPILLMFDGMSQVYDLENERLSVTRFDSFAYSLAEFLSPAEALDRTLRATDSLTLLRADPALQTELQASPTEMMAEVTERMNQAVQGLVIGLVGFAALLVGGFSRFGLWRQVTLAIVLLVVIKSLDNTFDGIISGNAALWPLRYLSSILALLMAHALLWKSAHPALWRSAPPPRSTTTEGKDA